MSQHTALTEPPAGPGTESGFRDRAPRRPAGGDRLAQLRSRILQVAARRRFVRRLSAGSRLALAVVVALAVIFLLDWTFSPGRATRVFMLAAAAIAVGRHAWRRVRPGLVTRESETDIALLIEKRQGIDSDLVAALEFAGSAGGAGSDDLREAVIDYVADFGRTWQMPREPVDPKLVRRLAWLAVAVAAIVGLTVARPDFASAFLNRMLLGSAHYPTRTRIESLVIGGRTIDAKPGDAAGVSVPQGRPLAFEAAIGGESPRLVRLRLQSSATGGASEIELTSAAAGKTSEDSSAPPGTAIYSARLPKLAETVDVQVFAGDAWTDPVRVTAIMPPLVDVALSATPPAYVRGRVERPPQGARQVTVLEGSRVGLSLRCTNKKLTTATLVVDGAEHPLRPRGSSGGTRSSPSAVEWEIPDTDSPLSRLERTVAYEVRVVDEDGLGADTPLVGTIRVKPDSPPRVTADVKTRLVLPSATPRLFWRVADDHGIGEVSIVAEPILAAAESRGPATGAEPSAVPGTGVSGRTTTVPVSLPVADGGFLGAERLPLDGSVMINLAPLGLRVGDQVRLVVRAVDHRGDTQGRETQSDPVVLEVTDERGILAALSESDERSVEQIDAIIDRELAVGGAR